MSKSKSLSYFVVPTSPWAYLGHQRIGQIAARHGVAIDLKPFDLGKVFPLSGGVPLPKRAPQRQAYRLVELRRWSTFLNVPMNIQPKYFPVDHDMPLRMIAAALQLGGAKAGFDVCAGLMSAVWAEQRNLADAGELLAIANASGLEGPRVIELAADMAGVIGQNTDQAIEAGVFGTPWYQIGDEGFWGQDRLEFVDRALAA